MAGSSTALSTQANSLEMAMMKTFQQMENSRRFLYYGGGIVMMRRLFLLKFKLLKVY